jgi:hypothetical protein|nr:hypothetical protein [Candidatus Cryosericum odellii]
MASTLVWTIHKKLNSISQFARIPRRYQYGTLITDDLGDTG